MRPRSAVLCRPPLGAPSNGLLIKIIVCPKQVLQANGGDHIAQRSVEQEPQLPRCERRWRLQCRSVALDKPPAGFVGVLLSLDSPRGQLESVIPEVSFRALQFTEMSVCSARPAAARWSVSAPPEIVVGEPLTVSVMAPRAEGSHALDWVGLYPSAIPTVFGASQGRWVYLNEQTAPPGTPHRDAIPQASSRRAAVDAMKEKGAASSRVVVLEWPSHMLPTHAGEFELRVHTANGYGQPVAKCRVHVMDGKLRVGRRLVVFALMGLAVWWFQSLLNVKGTCEYVAPDTQVDPIQDYATAALSAFNALLAADAELAAALQALCSLLMDVSMLVFLFVGSMRRTSMRPFIALFLFMSFRFVAQALAVMPCAPGFLWPRGAVLGVEIPTIFVDYHPANDYFFSGHTGTVLVVAIELLHMDYFRTGLFLILAVLPLETLMVLAFRVHRGIDVIAAVFAATSACSAAGHVAGALDRALMELKAGAQRDSADLRPGGAAGDESASMPRLAALSRQGPRKRSSAGGDSGSNQAGSRSKVE